MVYYYLSNNLCGTAWYAHLRIHGVPGVGLSELASNSVCFTRPNVTHHQSVCRVRGLSGSNEKSYLKLADMMHRGAATFF